MRRLLLVSTTALLALGLLPGAAGAQTFEHIERYDSEVTIQRNGVVRVQETIDYDFGSTPRHGIFRDIPVRVDYTKKADTDRVYDLDVLSVRVPRGRPPSIRSNRSTGGRSGSRSATRTGRSKALTATRSRTPSAT